MLQEPLERQVLQEQVRWVQLPVLEPLGLVEQLQELRFHRSCRCSWSGCSCCNR